MNGESANRFISALIKSLQTLCQGVDFNDGIEIIGHLYLNIDSGCSFDYILKEKVCKSAENSTVFVSKSYAAQSPAGELVTRKEKGHLTTTTEFDDSSVSALGTSRLQSAISSISNVLSGSENQKPRLLSLDQVTHGKRKREHNGSYSSMQPPYKYANLQTSSSSTYFNNKSLERNHNEHFSSSSHAEFFGGGGDSNQSSGMGPDDDDDLNLDVTFVKAEYSGSQRYSNQRGVSGVAASRLSQDPASSQSTSLHDQQTLGSQLNYPSTSSGSHVGHQQAPQQFTSGTASDLPGIGQAFQDTGQLDLTTAQHSMQGSLNPRSREGENSSLSSPTFTTPRGPAKFFRCPVCSIIIRHKNNIKRHMRRHNDPAANDNVDVHKAWGQHFVTAPLNTHTQDGRPIRTYSCPMCGLQISHRKNIRRHMRKHTGEMFFCDMCDWRGTCRWKMQKHREKKHGILPPLALAQAEQPEQIACSST